MSGQYYGFPDPLIPQAILSKRLFEQYPQLAANILRGFQLGFQAPNLHQTLVIEKLTEKSVIQDFLVSYLISTEALMEFEFEHPSIQPSQKLAWLFSEERQHNTCTIFKQTETSLLVDKFFVDCDASSIEEDEISFLALKDQPVYDGPLFDSFLERYAGEGEWANFEKLLNSYFETVFSTFSVNENTLSGNTVDMITRNCIVDNADTLKFFDQEYEVLKPIPKSFIIYRSCYSLMKASQSIFYSSPYTSIHDAYHHFCKAQGIAADLDRDISLENWFIGKVSIAGKRSMRNNVIRRRFSKYNKNEHKQEKQITKYKKKYLCSLTLNLALFISSLWILYHFL